MRGSRGTDGPDPKTRRRLLGFATTATGAASRKENLIGQCRDADVSCFVKQLGAVPLVKAARLRHFEWGTEDGDGRFEWWQNDRSGLWRVKLRDKKGGEPDEWPADLRVRQFPAATEQGREA
jgi:hypothetical protein